MKAGISLIIVFLYSCTSFSQEVFKRDTIKWSNSQLIIELPIKSSSHIDTYEEGFFKIITCYIDSAIITIHCGAMVNHPLIDISLHEITSEFIFDNEIKIWRGYKECYNGKKYFREEDYFSIGIAVLYENVNKNRLDTYERIFNNIIIKTINNGR